MFLYIYIFCVYIYTYCVCAKWTVPEFVSVIYFRKGDLNKLKCSTHILKNVLGTS